jgi:hypothetical protein
VSAGDACSSIRSLRSQMVSVVQGGLVMTITMGQLVAQFFEAYDREFHDEELAAVATQVRIAELLEKKPRTRRIRGSHPHAA